MACVKHWIPACAGMTGLLIHWHTFCSSAVLIILTPSSFQRRLESRRAESGCETDCDFPRSAGVTRLSFPLCGHGLCNPLDSGLRRNDGGEGCRFVPGGYGHSRRPVPDLPVAGRRRSTTRLNSPNATYILAGAPMNAGLLIPCFFPVSALPARGPRRVILIGMSPASRDPPGVSAIVRAPCRSI